MLSDNTLETPQKVSQEGSSRGLVLSSYLIVNNPSSRQSSITAALWRCTCSDKGHLDPCHVRLNQMSDPLLEFELNKFSFLRSHVGTGVVSDSKSLKQPLSNGRGNNSKRVWGCLLRGSVRCISICYCLVPVTILLALNVILRMFNPSDNY